MKISSWVRLALGIWSPIGIGGVMAGEIHQAAKDGNVAEVQRLLRADPWLASLGDGESFGDLPLQCAIIHGSAPVVELLIASKADVNAISWDGQTALHTAAIANSRPMVELLLQHGARVDARDRIGYSPLHFAVLHPGETGIVEALLAAGADVNMRTDAGKETPLLLAAAAAGNSKKVEILLQHGANVNLRDYEDITTVMKALNRRDTKTLEMLLQAGAPLNAQTIHGYTAIYLAVRNNDPEAAEVLLKHHADIDLEDENGLTPLGWCQVNHAERHAPAMAELLARYGAVQTGSRRRRTNIHSAALQGDAVRIGVLLAEDPQRVNLPEAGLGNTPLHNAVISGKRAAVEALLQHGADVNAVDKTGFTPLHVAAQCGDVELAGLLIASNANVDAADGDGRTPLHVASFVGNPRLIELLLKHGANANARTKTALTPLDLAKAGNAVAAMEILGKAGAK